VAADKGKKARDLPGGGKGAIKEPKNLTDFERRVPTVKTPDLKNPDALSAILKVLPSQKPAKALFRIEGSRTLIEPYTGRNRIPGVRVYKPDTFEGRTLGYSETTLMPNGKRKTSTGSVNLLDRPNMMKENKARDLPGKARVTPGYEQKLKALAQIGKSPAKKITSIPSPKAKETAERFGGVQGKKEQKNAFSKNDRGGLFDTPVMKGKSIDRIRRAFESGVDVSYSLEDETSFGAKVNATIGKDTFSVTQKKLRDKDLKGYFGIDRSAEKQTSNASKLSSARQVKTKDIGAIRPLKPSLGEVVKTGDGKAWEWEGRTSYNDRENRRGGRGKGDVVKGWRRIK
jgi:hypothetical protein